MSGLSTDLSRPEPLKDQFFNPWDDPRWIKYLNALRAPFWYIRFLGLPTLKDEPNATLDEFYVPLYLSRRHSPVPEAEAGETLSVEGLLADPGRVIVLGDPGSGKSTLVKYVTMAFASRREGPLVEALGRLIPLPIVLRDFRVHPEITFAELLDQLRDQPFWPQEVGPDDLAQVLGTGQAIVLLDGLDEIGDVRCREGLRRAILESAVPLYPRSKWLLTSRIVGYDDVAFHFVGPRIGHVLYGEVWSNYVANVEENRAEAARVGYGELAGDLMAYKELKYAEAASRFLAPVYVLPFSDEQIARFAHNWYALREPDEHRRQTGADSLVQAIFKSPTITRLARIPNLLTIMALVHRVRAYLPNGRALLFEDISQAYLHSIDEFYGIKSLDYPLAQKKRWLARVGFEMQRRRSEEPGERRSAESSDVLAAAHEVRSWVADAMEQSGYARDEQAAAAFVDYVGRRSGLLLPRGPEQFAFMHLSFQEYFAAVYLADQLISPRRVLGDEVLRGWAGQVVWRETMVFLFELLADKQDWSETVAEKLFGQDFGLVAKPGDEALGLAPLAAQLAADPHSGFTRRMRQQATRLCCERLLKMDPMAFDSMRELAIPIFSVKGDRLQEAWDALIDAVRGSDAHVLHLDGAPISDLAPLAGLTNLGGLFLNGTRVSDLAPLAGLSNLGALLLSNTRVSDLAPLAGLTNLKVLFLNNTRVSDLAPLAGLTNLNTLFLDDTRVSDLTPLAHLPNLRLVSIAEAALDRRALAALHASRKAAGLPEIDVRSVLT